MNKQIIIDIGNTIIDSEKGGFIPLVIQNLARMQDRIPNPVMLYDSWKNINLDGVLDDIKILESENVSLFRKGETIRIFSSVDELSRSCENIGLSIHGSFVISNNEEFLEQVKEKGAFTVLFKGDGYYDDRFNKVTDSWNDLVEWLILGYRYVSKERNTGETKIKVEMSLDGAGEANIKTGLGFFDHMLDQIARHSGSNLKVDVKGDIEVDEHHTIEDTAIVLGEAFNEALGDKKGIGRYGFALPMDDCAAMVLIDFGGRPDLVWKARFKRDKVGDLPTEMFSHFFKSFAIGARCNLYIKARGRNEHHKIEAIFKTFARAIKMAVKREAGQSFLPSTKGML